MKKNRHPITIDYGSVAALARGADESGEDDDGLTPRNTLPCLHPGAMEPLAEGGPAAPCFAVPDWHVRKNFRQAGPAALRGTL